MIRVFHCDDSVPFTRLVHLWLEDQSDIEWAGAEHDRDRVGDAVAAAQPDVVLLDTMGEPGDGGLIDAVHAAAPNARVIVYSGYVRLMGPHGLAGGADAYVDKSDAEGALVDAVRAVASA
jgi:DNA-binding NarL/FixJ family response regulator